MNDLRRMQLPDTPTEIGDFAVVMEFLETDDAPRTGPDPERADARQRAPEEPPGLSLGRRV